MRISDWSSDVCSSDLGYRMRAAAAGLPVPDTACFERDIDLVGVQRHLKVLGIFARLHHRDGKPRYLADAPRFLGYLDGVLPRYPSSEEHTSELQSLMRTSSAVFCLKKTSPACLTIWFSYAHTSSEHHSHMR